MEGFAAVNQGARHGVRGAADPQSASWRGAELARPGPLREASDASEGSRGRAWKLSGELIAARVPVYLASFIGESANPRITRRAP